MLVISGAKSKSHLLSSNHGTYCDTMPSEQKFKQSSTAACPVPGKVDFIVGRDLVSYTFLKDVFYFMCVNVLPACISESCVCLMAMEVRRECQIPWNWN